MEPEQRQRIIGYFLEETQEYLDLLEPGMGELESALADEERINELYRAAHSIKGGAAMLELDGIQKVAYRLESSLKFMKANPVSTSRDIEAKLLKGVLGIKRLVAEVRETQDNMTDASAAEVWGDIEPTFDVLDRELQAQVDGGGEAPATAVNASNKAVTEAGAAGQDLELPDFSSNAATDSGLDELSWDDIDDLTNLGDNPVPSRAAKPKMPDTTTGGIDGLDALANLFDESPLEAEDSLAWDQAAMLPGAGNSAALELEDFEIEDLTGLEASLGEASGSDDAAASDNLLADPLLGDDLRGDATPSANRYELPDNADFDDLFGESGDELSLDFEGEANPVQKRAPGLASELDDLDAKLDALGLEDLPLSDLADEPVDTSQSGGSDDDLLDLEGLKTPDQDAGDEAAANLDLDLDFAAELGNGSEAAGELDLGALLEDGASEGEEREDPENAIAALSLEAPETDTRGDFSAALDSELTEADTWVSEEAEAQQKEAAGTVNRSAINSPEDSASLDLGDSDLDDLDLGDLSGIGSDDDLGQESNLGDAVDTGEAVDLGDVDLDNVDLGDDSLLNSDEPDGSDGLVDIVDFAAELDAELESDLAGDLGLGSSVLETEAEDTEMSELDEFLDSAETELPAEPGSALGDLDSLLDEMASTEGPVAESGGSALEDDFDDLDSLLGDPPASAPQPEPTAKRDDFSDMEQLLQGTESLAGPASNANPVNAAPPAKTRSRSQRLREQSMRVPIKTLDNFNNLVGEMVVNRNSLEGDQGRLKQSLDKLVDHTQKLSDVGQKLQDLYERSLLENALLNSRRKVMGIETITAGASGLNLSASTPNSDSAVGDLDDLELDKFTGFHTLSQDIIELIVRVRESASDIDFLINESLDQDTRNFRQTTSQLQEEVNRSRMVPFAQTADRLPRAVRDIAHKCGKSARLNIEGRETLIDKMLIEQLHDPLTHLINNAVTHGIETQEERLRNGKPADGSIRLQAFYQGNQTVISVADDGAGIDPERIKQKAIEKGLVRFEDADQLGVSQLYDFLFHAGFSTRSQADAFAGRGVGMDVVRTRLQELRGTVVIDSELGKGTTFTIRLPLTLSITKALQCISNRARIAFPLDGVDDMFDIPKDQMVTDAEGNQTVQWRDMMLPVRELSDLLKYNRTIGRSSVYAGNADEDMAALVILRSAGEYLAVNVDRAEGEMDIVIKQLEGPVPKPTGIAGATVLSDGQVMPIADVLELIDISKGRTRQGAAALWEEEQAVVDNAPAEAVSTEPMVLIVDDSITVRELLSMSFAKAGYRVEQARDGQEAWEKLRSGLPCDLIFCDIEMPRMTGLELLEKLQDDEELKRLPMSMLTSRGADKHRQLAAKLGAKGYFTKPYLEEALLEAANKLLNGEVLLQLAES